MLLNAVSGDVDAPGFAERLARKGKRLRGLEERGWVEEAGDGTWTLTDEGRAAKERLGAVVDGIRSRVAGAVSPEDFATTLASLEAIARELGWDENEGGWAGFGRGFGRGRGLGRGFGPRLRPGFGPGLRPRHHQASARARHGFRPGFGPGASSTRCMTEGAGTPPHHRHGDHGHGGHGHGTTTATTAVTVTAGHRHAPSTLTSAASTPASARSHGRHDGLRLTPV